MTSNQMDGPMRYTIGWLYPGKMNIYGDRGNVIALEQRARWRGLDVEISLIEIGDQIPGEIDTYFFGGGQDQAQIAVARDLQGHKADQIQRDIDAGASLLSVCGGYQLLGRQYLPHDAQPLPGIGLFDAETVAGNNRFIGNVIVDSAWGELVGFENHSGLTYLGSHAKPFAKVRIGHGNNGHDGTEGIRYRNAIGCYLHGALLPKNPVLTDWLIESSLKRRMPDFALSEIDDHLEVRAHRSAVARANRRR